MFTSTLCWDCPQVVNAFASQSDVEMKGKVIERLHDITHLMQVLAKCLAGESVTIYVMVSLSVWQVSQSQLCDG